MVISEMNIQEQSRQNDNGVNYHGVAIDLTLSAYGRQPIRLVLPEVESK